MNPFIISAKELIYRNGINITYNSINISDYDVETGSVQETTSSTSLKGFPKALKANQYHHPNLVGKTASEWLIVALDLSSIPKPNDTILKGVEVLKVDSYSEHYADGEVVIYKIIAVKG